MQISAPFHNSADFKVSRRGTSTKLQVSPFPCIMCAFLLYNCQLKNSSKNELNCKEHRSLRQNLESSASCYIGIGTSSLMVSTCHGIVLGRCKDLTTLFCLLCTPLLTDSMLITPSFIRKVKPLEPSFPIFSL